MPSSRVDLEIVIAVLDESSNIKVVVEQLIEVFSRTSLCLSVIFVDDGSTDDTWQEIKRVKKLPRRDKTNSRCKIDIKGIRLIRNLGQMRAIEVGLRCTSAPYVIVMDGDLQHPPEVALELWRKRESADTVAARQILRQERLLKGLASQFFYRVISLVSGERYLSNISDFRILSRNTIRIILASKQPIKVIRFLVPRLGLKQSYIDYHPRIRSDGTRSRYTIQKMMTLAFQSIMISSTRMLKMSLMLSLMYLTFFIGVVLYAGYFLLSQNFAPGWISIIGTLIFSFALNFLVLSIISVYVLQLVIAQDAAPIEYVEEFK